MLIYIIVFKKSLWIEKLLLKQATLERGNYIVDIVVVNCNVDVGVKKYLRDQNNVKNKYVSK